MRTGDLHLRTCRSGPEDFPKVLVWPSFDNTSTWLVPLLSSSLRGRRRRGGRNGDLSYHVRQDQSPWDYLAISKNASETSDVLGHGSAVLLPQNNCFMIDDSPSRYYDYCGYRYHTATTFSRRQLKLSLSRLKSVDPWEHRQSSQNRPFNTSKSIKMSPKILVDGSTEEWNESKLEVPLRLPGHDGRTIRVVSGRGYRYVLPFPYKLQWVVLSVPSPFQSSSMVL